MPKADKSTNTDAIENAVNAAQVIFSLNPAYTPQATHLRQAQERFLKEAEKFSSAWFKRRQQAIQSALDLTGSIANGGLKDPSVAIKAMTEWQTGCMERLADDAKDCTEMMTLCIGNLVENEIEAVKETAEITKRAATEKHATPV